jgi:hypothetical protein
MKIQVHYEVPVSAFVDMESGTVERVAVGCEGIEELDNRLAVVDADTPAAGDAQGARARSRDRRRGDLAGLGPRVTRRPPARHGFSMANHSRSTTTWLSAKDRLGVPSELVPIRLLLH